MEKETAMKILKELHDNSLFSNRTALETIIPELKESEDEKIRKALVRFHKSTIDIDGIKGADILAWLEKQGNIDKTSYDIAEKEKYDFVSGRFIKCRKSFDEFKEDTSYWLEYVGNDNYIGRSDNILNQKFHITPRQLYCLFTQEHCPKEDNANAPTEYGKYVDECLNDASEHFFSEGEDKYSVADLFYAGVRCGKSWFEKQGTSTKLSEEEQNSFSKGVLSNCALSFINYLDTHSYEGKMCVSNGECEDIENAFHNAMWDRLHRYYCKYIEKQGEQKPILDFKASNWYVSKVDGKIHDMTYNPTNKIKPKFKVGDYIVSDYCTGRVIEITSDAYLLDIGQGIPFSCEYNVHLWTIQDAKDGDMLIDKSGSRECPFIFKETKPSDIKTDMLNPLAVLGYCGIGGAGFTKGSGWGDTANCIYYPATKEQRDTLMKAMTDAGYEWNAEKKELKLLIINGGDFEPKQEWSEKDMSKVQRICKYLDEAKKYYVDITEVRECVNWLKSLEDRVWHNSWKPSKEQIHAFEQVYEWYNDNFAPSETLTSLYNDLKKL